MKKLIVILGLVSLSSTLFASTYNCKMNEKFPKKLPKTVELIVGDLKANLRSDALGKCKIFKELKGSRTDSGSSYLVGAVDCENGGTINLLFDALITSKINLTLSGDEYSYPSIGESNYICNKTK